MDWVNRKTTTFFPYLCYLVGACMEALRLIRHRAEKKLSDCCNQLIGAWNLPLCAAMSALPHAQTHQSFTLFRGQIMKTQNVFKTLAMVAFSAISLGLVACSELGSNPAEPMAMFNNVQTTFDLNGQPVEFTDASLEIPMEVRERPDTAKKGPRSPFDRLLASLNLTPDQKVQVERLLAAHKDCATAALEALKTAERAILDRAKAAREEIKASVEAGTITRDEARQKVRDLNKATREAIKNLPEREAARAALKECDDRFLTALRGILTEQQITILDKFIAARNGRTGGGPRDGDKGGRDSKDSTGGKGPGGRGPRGGGSGDSTGTGGRG